MDYKNRDINSTCTLLKALKLMDALDIKLLIIIDDNKFVGLVSIGDIQRAIIKNHSLDISISEILRKNIRIAHPDDTFESIKKMMFDYRMELCPVVTNDNEIIKIYFWEDIFQKEKPQPKLKFDMPVVIMAGGFGTRLKPITNVLPKPLLPIGERTIIEDIFERFHDHGCNSFYVSVNYKADLIEYYLNNQGLKYHLSFFREEKPMGTAGSLSLLKGIINEAFFVSNCDIIIDQDYSEILDFHRENNNEITVVAALRHYPIPYGTIRSGKSGKLEELIEKPELTFKINSGMYILEPHLISEIPVGQFFHITHLINKVIMRGGNVGVFPVPSSSWKDIGDWDEYLKCMKNG